MNGNIYSEGHEYYFVGNYYEKHDGYDGSVFAIGGVSPCLVASLGRIPHVLTKDADNENKRADSN